MTKILKKVYRIFSPAVSSREIRKKYNIPEKIILHLELSEDGWLVITSPDLPGLITQARNAKELLEMANDAILTYYNVPKKETDIAFKNLNFEGQGIISYKPQLEQALV